MVKQPKTKCLYDLTEVPAGWPLATVIDAFVELAACDPICSYATRALQAVSHRLVDLWASQPAEAEAWLTCEATRTELLSEALRRHGAAEYGKYMWHSRRFSEAGLLRGWSCGSAPEREERAPCHRQRAFVHDRCRQLAERLAAAESQDPARKRQKLEEETSERRRREAELHTSQEQECRDLCNRLAAAEAEVSSKDAELQAAQSESAKCKEQCEELATRAAAAEAAAAELQKELRQLQEEHRKCQEYCEELAKHMDAEASEHAKTKELLARAESGAAEKQLEVQRLQEESQSYQERCPKTDSQPASAEEAGSKAELQLEKEKAVLQGRCEQLQHQLAKAEAKLELMQNLREEIGMYKERLRGLEHELATQKRKQDTHHFGGPTFNEAAASGQEFNLAERLGYSFVESEDDGTCSSLLSHSSWFSVKPDSVKPHCFMLDAIFKTRSYGTDFFLMGRDLQKGSQVVAGDDATILTVAKTPEICEATEVVDLHAGAATLQVTPDHLVQVFDAKGGSDDYLPAGALKTGDWVMLDSGEPVALTSAKRQAMECKVLKIRLEPHLPVAVFSRPTCILSLGHKPKPPIRRGGRGQGQVGQSLGPSDESRDGGASIPVTAGDYMN